MMRVLKDRFVLWMTISRRIKLHPEPSPFLRKLCLVILRLLSASHWICSVYTFTRPIRTWKPSWAGSLHVKVNSWLRFVGFIKPLYNFRTRSRRCISFNLSVRYKQQKSWQPGRWIDNISKVNYHIKRGAAEFHRNSNLWNVIRIIRINHRVHFKITSVNTSSAAFPSLSGSRCNTSRAFAA